MGVVIKKLSKEFLTQNIADFIMILEDVPNEYWTEQNFVVDLFGKYKISCVALIDDKVVGYIIASEKDILRAHIHKFMVSSNYRGKGIGQMLYSYCERIIARQNYSTITLFVYQNNERGINFYSNLNFSLKEEKVDSAGNQLLLLYKNIK